MNPDCQDVMTSSPDPVNICQRLIIYQVPIVSVAICFDGKLIEFDPAIECVCLCAELTEHVVHQSFEKGVYRVRSAGG